MSHAAPTPRFAVTGVTGGIGGRVATRLADAGFLPVMVARNPARVPAIAGAPVRLAEYDDPAALEQAFAGVTTLFMVSAAEHPDRVRLHHQVVDAAAAAGVQRIVYTSFVGAAPDATFTFARDHWATEEYLRASGLAFTSLRDSMYQDFLPGFAGRDGVMRGPAGDGALGAVARSDIADVAVRVMLDDDVHDGQVYDLTGPETWTLTEVAAELSVVTGREVRFENETEEQAYASRAGQGADFEIAGWVTSYQAIATGELSPVTDTVERLTGSPALSFREFLKREPGSFQHLLP
jgi:NAD(P)H dehydrogenase (quinone)